MDFTNACFLETLWMLYNDWKCCFQMISLFHDILIAFVISGHFVMFVDIFVKKELVDFDQNHTKLTQYTGTLVMSKDSEGYGIIFSYVENMCRKTD